MGAIDMQESHIMDSTIFAKYPCCTCNKKNTLSVVTERRMDGDSYVRCSACGHCGPKTKEYKKAIALWLEEREEKQK